MLRRAIVCLTVLASMGLAASAEARVFYVSPAGRDSRSGQSPGAAWRTVHRVNRAALRPGDVVDFQGGGTFSDAQLMPRNSGASGAPIRFTSYGGGRATLTRGVWFASIAWITIDGLRITGVADGIASGYGLGARHVAIRQNVISDVGIAVNSTNHADYAWTIIRNHIVNTRDSGVVMQGGWADIEANQITNTGTDSAIPYDKHGIYSKGPLERIVGNRIVRFSAQGISTRYRDAFIAGNVIEGGDAGVGYWQQDARAGTTSICGNTILGVRYGVLIGPQSGESRERFRLVGNHIATTGGPGVYQPFGHPALSATRNLVTTRRVSALKPAGAQACDQPQDTASLAGPTVSVLDVLGSIMRTMIGVAKAFGSEGA
ncbi:MAG: right-handed parallel beta-helix repeat-containing protein, partial [Acetobacteraceae bacterium]